MPLGGLSCQIISQLSMTLPAAWQCSKGRVTFQFCHENALCPATRPLSYVYSKCRPPALPKVVRITPVLKTSSLLTEKSTSLIL